MARIKRLPDNMLPLLLLAPKAARTAGMRLLDLLVSLQVEACEIASAFGCLSWIIPISIDPSFLRSSIYLIRVEAYLPRSTMFALFGSLCAFQSIAMLLGGAPSVFIRSAENAQRWLMIRRTGVFASISIWAYLSALLMQITVTPGGVLYGCVSVASLWGYWRLSLLIKVEEEVKKVRAVELITASIP